MKEKKPYVDIIIEKYMRSKKVPKINWKKIDIQDLTPEKIKILNEMVGARNLAEFIRKIDPIMYKVINVLRKNGFYRLLPGGYSFHKDDENFMVFLDYIGRTCYFYRRDENNRIRILNVSFDKILKTNKRR